MENLDVEKISALFSSWQPHIISYALKIIGAIFIIWVAFKIANIFSKIILKGFEARKVDMTVSRSLSNLLKYLIILLAIISALGIVGVPTASFAAAIAAMGLAIGLALQGSLGNFAAGVLLLSFRPFKVGDAIKVSGETGTVYSIDLFSTILNTFDNRRLIVPNGSVFGNLIENLTHNPTRRVDVPVGVAYGADIDETRKVLMSTFEQVDNIINEPAEPAVVLVGLGDSSVNWVLRAHTRTENYWPLKEALTRSVKYALDKADIEIPFPQMDIGVRSLPANAGIVSSAQANSNAGTLSPN